MALIQDPNNPRFLSQSGGEQVGPTAVRNLQIQSGDPASLLSRSQGQAQQVSQSTPSVQFGLALQGLLQKYQQLGTGQFAQQGFNAQEEQARRTLSETSPELLGASPGLQSGVRGASAQALDPTVQGAKQGAQTFKEQLAGFGSAVGSVQDLLKNFQEQENKQRDDARMAIQNALTTVGGDAFASLDPAEVQKIEKTAGYPKGYLSGITKTLKQREIELKRQNSLALGGFTPAQINATINQIAGNFDNEQLVKDFNQVAQGYRFVKSLPDKTVNPADDQALIYSLAKVLDPGSVVREGEYATAQKYSQSWIKAYGKGVSQAINGTGFLSEEARKNIKNTIESKYKTSQSLYNNLRKEYQRQIDDARTGKPRQITEYTPPEAQRIKVKVNTSGKTGTIPVGEFDPRVYTKI